MTIVDILNIVRMDNFRDNEKLRIAADLILDVALNTDNNDLDEMQRKLREVV